MPEKDNRNHKAVAARILTELSGYGISGMEYENIRVIALVRHYDSSPEFKAAINTVTKHVLELFPVKAEEPTEANKTATEL